MRYRLTEEFGEKCVKRTPDAALKKYGIEAAVIIIDKSSVLPVEERIRILPRCISMIEEDIEKYDSDNDDENRMREFIRLYSRLFSFRTQGRFFCLTKPVYEILFDFSDDLTIQLNYAEMIRDIKNLIKLYKINEEPRLTA